MAFFIIRKGIIRFGLIFTLVTLLMSFLFKGYIEYLDIIVFTGIGLIIGIIWGFYKWGILTKNENKFNKFLHDRLPFFLIYISLISAIGAQALNFITFEYFKIPTSGFMGINGINQFIFAFVSLCVISPIFETLLMIPIISGIKRLSHKRWVITVLSALIWAALHATVKIGWGIPAFWLFLIFTIVFEDTKTTVGVRLAVVYTSTLHFLTNLLILSSNLIYYRSFGPKNW
jgi:membrane protease YdiL (CAAX protease family)